MRTPDPDDPEKVLRRDDNWPLVVAGTAILFVLITMTPFVLTYVV